VRTTLLHGIANAALLLFVSGSAVGAQTVTVSGNPSLLRVSSAVAGSQPASVSSATTTYTVTTPSANRTYKITAQLNSPMPVGTTLQITLASPPGGTSLGAVTLDGTARDVLTGVRKNLNSTQSITYAFSATTAAGVVPSTSRLVTLTIVQVP
jgi:hypothetical protein